jgi:hypothetical protein
MEVLIQFIAVGIIFFIVSYFTWWYTEKQHTPEFLNYRPFSCRLCATYWLLTGIYIALGISFKLWVVLIAGCVLAGLNAIAMKVHQKNNTVRIEDFDEYNNYETVDCDEILVDDNGFKVVKK